MDQNSSNWTHLSYWLAEALTLVRKTKKIIDPGNNPGDIIPKGGFFLKVKYFMLKDMASLKYVVAPMGVAFVDFVNVVTCTRFYWNKIYRGQNPSSQIYQLSRRTHGLISYQVKLHGSLWLSSTTQVFSYLSNMFLFLETDFSFHFRIFFFFNFFFLTKVCPK